MCPSRRVGLYKTGGRHFNGPWPLNEHVQDPGNSNTIHNTHGSSHIASSRVRNCRAQTSLGKRLSNDPLHISNCVSCEWCFFVNFRISHNRKTESQRSVQKHLLPKVLQPCLVGPGRNVPGGLVDLIGQQWCINHCLQPRLLRLGQADRLAASPQKPSPSPAAR